MPKYIDKDINVNVDYFNKVLMIDKSYDLIYLTFQMGGRVACLYYVNGFVKDQPLQKLLESFGKINQDSFPENAHEFMKHIVNYISVDKLKEPEKIIRNILSGIAVFFIDGFEEAISIDCREYPARGVEEPQKDKVMRGSRDGFVETIALNTALIRRRIRNPKLVMKMMEAGESSKTDIVVAYMEERVDEKMLDRLVRRIQGIKIDSLSMNQESLAECLYTKKWINPFPKVKYTERPDTAAASLLEGNIIILVDNSPSVMILPTSIFDIIEEADDYYFPPVTGTYLRLSRFVINIVTLLLTPTFILLMANPDWIPESYAFINVKETMNIPLIWQFLILEFAIDGLRLASLSTPSMLTMPLSIVAGIVVGEYSVSSGWFNSETMLYMAFVVIAGYSQASFELSYALKFMRIILLILTAIFGIWGYLAGILLTILCIAFNKTIAGKSYIYPLIPLNGKKLLRRFFRVSLPKSENQ